MSNRWRLRQWGDCAAWLSVSQWLKLAQPCVALQCPSLWSMIVVQKTPTPTMATKTRATQRDTADSTAALARSAGATDSSAVRSPTRAAALSHRSRNDRPACHSSLPCRALTVSQCPPPRPSFHRATWARRVEVSTGRSAWKRRRRRRRQ